MEEQHMCVTQQHSADMKEGSESTNMDHVSSSDEDKQTEDNGRGMENALPPKDMDMLKKEEEEIKQQRNTVENIGPSQETTESTVPEVTGGHAEDHTGENKAHDRKHDQGDGHKVGHEEDPGPKDTNIEAGGDNGRYPKPALSHKDTNLQEKTTSVQKALRKEIMEEKEIDEQSTDVETTDSASNEKTEPPGSAGSGILADNKKDLTQPPNMTPVPPFEEDEQTKTVLTVKQAKDKHHKGENKQPETTTSSIQGDRNDDQVGSHRAELKEESPDSEDRNTEPGVDNGTGVKCASEDMDMLKKDEELRRVTPEEIIESTVPEVTGILAGRMRYLIAASIVVVVAILWQYFLQTESPPQTNHVRQIDIFLRELEKMKTQFPSQRAELWNRSRIHLQKHLQTPQPTEPVSLILTAGLRAERTMHCLAQGLASAFSSALNASVLHIDGVSQASQDSDQVKLDIDRELQGAFEGNKPVAVIHRFEELPPGSTLIFYRYCDHENAAYKKTFLIFTVLLGEEEEIPAKIRLSVVEEMVDDHLQKKFLSHGHPVSFDMMDLDKYGGLWSRISHLILPVAAEERIEHEGCKGT